MESNVKTNLLENLQEQVLKEKVFAKDDLESSE